MIVKSLKKIFGTRNDRELKRISKVVKQINALEEDIQALDDTAIKAKADELKARVADGATLDQVLPEAFALAREAGVRALGLRHFDVQLIGGIALHEGNIAEMRTGEGKTLVATLPAFLNALSGNNVHLVTVNDYLASRDAAWMQPLYEFLGMSVGVIRAGQSPEEKRAAYQCDIVYGTNNEFGFDYLRDNMAFALADKAQRDLSFAIVDEVDSILIDEARTPLIISGAAEDSSELYKAVNRLIPKLTEASDEVEGDYTVDEKHRQIELTEDGHEKTEAMLVEAGLLEEGDSLYAATNLKLLHHVHTGLRAHVLFQRDVEYIVQEGQVVLIDEHTGRTMPGRRLSEGLHQAIEAKEGVSIHNESQTMASTTFQNYFRLYGKLSGMTGTADTEAFEFKQIYGLDVLVVPTNKPMVRNDLNDLVYLSQEEKFDAIVEDVKSCIESNAPVLVGTASVETSEELSAKFRAEKVEHKVLNAKYHAQEAEIIAQAGRPGVVTIATNMAGRGTDIVLGGSLDAELKAAGDIGEEKKAAIREEWQRRHDAVMEAGGLHILGTERHESRRIDNQLRGRAGRQGDPGVTRFYLSLEDSLMRIFASDRVKGFMQALGMEKGEAIEHKMVTNAIEKAQRKVEGRNFDIRKQLLEYDDVANDQRQIIYRQRNQLLSETDVSETITTIRRDVVNEAIDTFVPPMSVEEQWDVPGLERHLEAEFVTALPVAEWLEADTSLHEESLRERIVAEVQGAYDAKAGEAGPGMRHLEKQIMLQVLDTLWKEHLQTMDQLRQGIHLRAYANKNPKQEYKRESFALFESLLIRLKYEVIRFLSHVQIQNKNEAEQLERQRREEAARKQLAFEHAEANVAATEAGGPDQAGTPAAPPAKPQQVVRDQPKVGRNDPCPCGSGKKYKQCHGALA
ncbi:preprotein translocase, SecA subunit [Luminiphilus syltensis NOR5-1B]|uniref:Protein translocase subunit SecA n=1 Tax=Luminiphilus syltensis NOR5-1B TaxID=565045 RepID=B8KR43_9GAMM|nr:preprotein translocase subunit SecA [Luminiphilus syltensis]EED36734.1 preprotein translocase, SecA subunit [Luminiphilus syltensis NOR5-1B]